MLLSFSLALSAVALSSIGLLLIFVRIPISASDSAVVLCSIKSSTLSGLRILWKISSCRGVGVIKIIYSSMTEPRWERTIWYYGHVRLGGKWSFSRLASRRRTKLLAIVSSWDYSVIWWTVKIIFSNLIHSSISQFHFCQRGIWRSTLEDRHFIDPSEGGIVVYKQLAQLKARISRPTKKPRIAKFSLRNIESSLETARRQCLPTIAWNSPKSFCIGVPDSITRRRVLKSLNICVVLFWDDFKRCPSSQIIRSICGLK